jgi:hypothetical protein
MSVFLQLCKVLLSEGYDVLATCRTTSAELDATSAKVVPGRMHCNCSKMYAMDTVTPHSLPVATCVAW